MNNAIPSSDGSRNACNKDQSRAGKRGKRRRWRIVPAMTFTNWKQEPGFQPVPNIPWFSVKRSWEGRVIDITVKYYALRLDFRYDWMADLAEL